MELTCDTLADLLTDHLHGSGWDGKWHVSEGKTVFFCTIGYHCMNENGYYDGWIDVNVNVKKSDCTLSSVTFTASRYHRRKYLTGQTDYFYDTVHYALSEIREKI